MYKSINFKGLCVVLAMVVAGYVAKAQMPEASFYFNGFLPTANFNDASHVVDEYEHFTPMNCDNVAMDAAAGLGLSARFGIWCDIGYGELLPFAEASVLWNASNAKVRDAYEMNDMNNTLGKTPTVPNYFNVPLMAGLKYRYSITTVKPFVEFALGCDFMFVTPNGYRHEQDLWYAYKPTGSFCWTVGAGTYLGPNVSVGLYYMGLGDHRIEYTSRTKDNLNYESNNYIRRSIGEFALRFGFHF